MDVNAFQESVKKGDLAAVKAAAAEDRGLVTAKNSAGQSAILLASYYRQPAVADYILSLEPELDIYEACAAGNLPAVQRALNTDGTLLESHSSDGWTPLHLAAFFGQKRIAETLMDRGASIEARSTNRMANTPLHAAVAGGSAEMVELLLERGADIEARQEGGWTALHGAAQSGNRAMVEALLARGADPQVRAANNQTPLDLALLAGKAEMANLLQTADAGAKIQ